MIISLVSLTLMEENSVRSSQAKRGSDEIRRDEAALEEKRQKVGRLMRPE